MRILLTFGEGSISSSESLVLSALGVRLTGVWAAGVIREVGFAEGDPRLMVPEAQSVRETPALGWRLPWRCLGLLPASGTPTEKTGVPGPFPFRKSSPTWDCVAGPEFGNNPVCEIDWGSGGLGTGPVWISLIRWSSSLAERNESSPAPFRCFQVWTPPLAPQPLANCAQPPPLLPPCIGSQSEIRFGPSIALASEFRWAELASGCPGKPVHQSCVFHEDG